MFLAGDHGLPAACGASRVAGFQSLRILLADADQRPLQFLERVLTNPLHNRVHGEARGQDELPEIGAGNGRQQLAQLAQLGLSDFGGTAAGQVTA